MCTTRLRSPSSVWGSEWAAWVRYGWAKSAPLCASRWAATPHNHSCHCEDRFPWTAFIRPYAEFRIMPRDFAAAATGRYRERQERSDCWKEGLFAAGIAKSYNDKAGGIGESLRVFRELTVIRPLWKQA